MDVGKRLRQVRESKNISVYELSKVSDVSESHIRNLERGTKSATVETLEMLVNSLNMTMADFFNIDDNVTYLTQDEQILLKYYRTLSKDTSKAIIEFCEKLYNAQ